MLQLEYFLRGIVRKSPRFLSQCRVRETGWMGGVERMQHSILVSQCRLRETGWMGGVERMQHSMLVSQCRVRVTGWMGGVERMQHSILVSVRTGLLYIY